MKFKFNNLIIKKRLNINKNKNTSFNTGIFIFIILLTLKNIRNDDKSKLITIDIIKL